MAARGSLLVAGAAAAAVMGGLAVLAYKHVVASRRPRRRCGCQHPCEACEAQRRGPYRHLRVVGVMSGTSVDGIDVAVADICMDRGRIVVRQHCFATVPWNERARARIFELFRNPVVHLRDLGRLDADLGREFGVAVLQVLREKQVPPETVDIIACHGQTIFHDPPYATTQIGQPSVIAEVTGIPTIANFRVADVAVGGQGAPLTSSFDWYVLRPARGSGWRAVQNIGGIGNVTLLPAEDGLQPLAFDTGPGNVFIDMAAQLCDPSVKCDMDGKFGEAGTVDQVTLRDALALEFFELKPPKSTGRELFTPELFTKWWKAAQARGVTPQDMVATMTEFTALTIVQAYKEFAPGRISNIVVGGGGARNPFLMKRLTALAQSTLGGLVTITTHEAIGIDSDAKEALAFALLGYLCHFNLPGNVPSCTGASRPTILGQISPARMLEPDDVE